MKTNFLNISSKPPKDNRLINSRDIPSTSKISTFEMRAVDLRAGQVGIHQVGAAKIRSP
jgi:hypothetical protein